MVDWVTLATLHCSLLDVKKWNQATPVKLIIRDSVMLTKHIDCILLILKAFVTLKLKHIQFV